MINVPRSVTKFGRTYQIVNSWILQEIDSLFLRHHSVTQLVNLRNYWSLDLTVKQTRNFVSRLKYVTIMPRLHRCETGFSFPTERCFKLNSAPCLRVPLLIVRF